MEENTITEKDYQVGIDKAMTDLVKAYDQYLDGAIMLSELSQFPVALAYSIAVYQIFIDLEQFKPKDKE